VLAPTSTFTRASAPRLGTLASQLTAGGVKVTEAAGVAVAVGAAEGDAVRDAVGDTVNVAEGDKEVAACCAERVAAQEVATSTIAATTAGLLIPWLNGS
jgi:hypothetical protein